MQRKTEKFLEEEFRSSRVFSEHPAPLSSRPEMSCGSGGNDDDYWMTYSADTSQKAAAWEIRIHNGCLEQLHSSGTYRHRFS